VVGLKAFLQQCLWIGRRSRNGISVTQFLAERAVDEATGSRQSAIDKDRANDRFNTSASKAALRRPPLFSSPRPNRDEIAEPQLREAFAKVWALTRRCFMRDNSPSLAADTRETNISHKQTEDRITEKLKRFVVQSRACAPDRGETCSCAL
jgi:hypothetical protein